MSKPIERIIKTNGISLNVVEQGEGPLVLLCHGFPESWYSWRHQIDALAAAGFRVVAPDMRGYGKSDRPEAIDQYTIFHLVGDVVGLLDAMAVPIGNFRLSLLLVLKGGVTLAIFVWIANAVSRLAEQRLRVFTPLTPAVQVLASKLVRMTLLTLAVVLALGSIGIDLTAFAVFSGAIGVGVGFGLQKVVSNLVSGVILLMDRSIKPGDVIEIDDTHGSVIALNARYASVQTRDGKEFLIPNEDLITQRVTNWSFSSDLIRQHVRVGISYQCNPHEAIELAVEAARDVPRVLREPAPNCLLVEFGDSTINLDLRFWITDPVNGTGNVRSEVMLKLWDLFQQNGIEIPSPQRELTLRNPEVLARAMNGQIRGLHTA